MKTLLDDLLTITVRGLNDLISDKHVVSPAALRSYSENLPQLWNTIIQSHGTACCDSAVELEQLRTKLRQYVAEQISELSTINVSLVSKPEVIQTPLMLVSPTKSKPKPRPKPNQQYFDVHQAAEYLGITSHTLFTYNSKDSGPQKTPRKGKNPPYVYTKEALDEWLEKYPLRGKNRK